MKRHLVPSLLLALAVSGCSMIHVGGLKNPLGGAEPTAKGGEPSASSTATTTDATSNEEYVKCNLTILDKQEKEITATLAASHALTSAQQDAKVSVIGDRYRKQQEQSCDKHLKKLEGTLKTFIDARSAERRKLWDDTAALRATLAKAP